ncbi:hypothetical protein AB0I55_25505 [Actinocatenispora sera]|uniref:hypothetical protein n=1 Tax=Actinocatenispora sera TaxID=390989 RepID=UPI0033C03956
MRMTVGPLPPAVYWRRRVVVLAGVALVVVLTVWACSPGAPKTSSGPHAAGAKHSSRPGSGSGSGTATGPVTGDPSPTGSASASPTPTAGSGDGAPVDASAVPPPADDDEPAGHCSDDALTVSVRVDPRTMPAGSTPALYLTIGNGSRKACTRDIGADQQELYVKHGDTTVWSSDYCDANHGSDVRRFDPGVHVTYRLVWDGRTASKGCKTARHALSRGSYSLDGRVGTKHAKPFPLTVT